MRILSWDIETSPIIAPVWGLWQNDIYYEHVLCNWHIICASAKWLGEDEVISIHPFNQRSCKVTFSNDWHNDYFLVARIHQLLSEADVLVAHNGDRFDLKKFNARALFHGFDPIPPIPSIDTLKVAKKHFKFDSNRLDYLGEFLGLGRKMSTPKGLWLDAIRGEEYSLHDPSTKRIKEITKKQKKAIKIMSEYCDEDVRLLEKVYLRLRPYMTNHPNRNIFNDDDIDICPSCGSEGLIKRGFAVSRTGKKQRYKCSDCATWCSAKKSIKNINIR